MKKQYGICLCLGAALWFGGCGATQQSGTAYYGSDKPQTRVNVREGTARVYRKQSHDDSNDKQNDGITRTSDYDKAKDSAAERAQVISDSVISLAEIEKASVVITGNTAIVGIELTGELNDDNLIRCKKLVEEKVRAADSAIDHVAVTAADSLVKRIHKMSNPDARPEEPPSIPDPLLPVVDELTPVS